MLWFRGVRRRCSFLHEAKLEFDSELARIGDCEPDERRVVKGAAVHALLEVCTEGECPTREIPPRGRIRCLGIVSESCRRVLFLLFTETSAHRRAPNGDSTSIVVLHCTAEQSGECVSPPRESPPSGAYRLAETRRHAYGL